MARAAEKQRLKTNRKRLRLLLYWGLAGALLYSVANARRYRLVHWSWFLFAAENVCVWSLYGVLVRAAAPEFDKATGALVDAGLDLGAPGVLEYLNDTLYVLLLAESLASLSNWCWLLLVTIPGFLIYQLLGHLGRGHASAVERASLEPRPGRSRERPLPRDRAPPESRRLR
jgi:hypothetical protein